jgi:metal-responsive CopG/Arc/MetJ family transcriptional regulator
MALQNDKQLQMRVSDDFLRKIDNWRRQQDDLPGRSEAIRRLVEQALDSQTKKR